MIWGVLLGSSESGLWSPGGAMWGCRGLSGASGGFLFFLGVLCECARGYWVLVVVFCSSWFITIIIIIFISSLCKIVKNANKNQPSSRYNYSSHATKRTKKNVRLHIISSVVRTTASIYWITINTMQLKLYYK